MINVFFDHQKFSTQTFGGISRYFATIIEEIKKNDNIDYVLGVLFSNNYYLKDSSKPLFNFIANKLLKSEYGKRTEIINELYCKYLLSKNEFDVFHPTYYDTYFISKLKKPLVITVHDMTHEKLPEYFWAQSPLTHNKRRNIEKADKIIAISESTKNDLLELTNIDEKKIDVVYHGIDNNTPLVFEMIPNLPDQYILFVGDRSGYKNFYTFIDAFVLVSALYPTINIILCGGGALGIADLEIISQRKLVGKVKHLQVNDYELNYLYRNALVFVYPSLYEGFGLPILEAYKANCPIILSDIDCFKEVAGNAALYFSKHEKEDLASKIISVIENNQTRTNLIDLGSERIKLFPLDTSMQKTLDIYRYLAQ